MCFLLFYYFLLLVKTSKALIFFFFFSKWPFGKKITITLTIQRQVRPLIIEAALAWLSLLNMETKLHVQGRPVAREVYTDIQQLAKAHKWLWIVVALRYGNKGNIFLQLVSQHRCIASWNPLLHALPRLWPTCHEAKYSASLRNFTHIIGQSCVIKAGFLFHMIKRFHELALRLLAVNFFLNFPCQWSSLSITQYEAQFNIWQLGEKYFCDSSSNPFSFFFLLLVWRDKEAMIAVQVSVQGKFMT